MKPALTHIALEVADTNKSAAFYADWCGMEITHRRSSDIEGQDVIWIASPDYKDLFVIVLIPGRKKAKKPLKTEIEHLGFSVESKKAVKALEDWAIKEGILFWPYEENAAPVGTTCGVLDPDGNVVEFSYDQPIGLTKGHDKKERRKMSEKAEIIQKAGPSRFVLGLSLLVEWVLALMVYIYMVLEFRQFDNPMEEYFYQAMPVAFLAALLFYYNAHRYKEAHAAAFAPIIVPLTAWGFLGIVDGLAWLMYKLMVG